MPDLKSLARTGVGAVVPGGSVTVQALETVANVFGIGGKVPKAPVPETAAVAHMLAVLSADERAYLQSMYERGYNSPGKAMPTNPAELARLIGGGKDGKFTSAEGKAFGAAANEMLTRAATRPAAGAGNAYVSPEQIAAGGSGFWSAAPPNTSAPAPTGPAPAPTAAASATSPGGPARVSSPWINIGFGVGIPPYIWIGGAVAVVALFAFIWRK